MKKGACGRRTSSDDITVFSLSAASQGGGAVAVWVLSSNVLPPFTLARTVEDNIFYSARQGEGRELDESPVRRSRQMR